MRQAQNETSKGAEKDHPAERARSDSGQSWIDLHQHSERYDDYEKQWRSMAVDRRTTGAPGQRAMRSSRALCKTATAIRTSSTIGGSCTRAPLLYQGDSAWQARASTVAIAILSALHIVHCTQAASNARRGNVNDGCSKAQTKFSLSVCLRKNARALAEHVALTRLPTLANWR
jgi:hypothetical protein